MGIGGISVWQLLIILAIVVMLFGTKRLRTLGSDLGSAVKGFRKSMTDDGEAAQPGDATEQDVTANKAADNTAASTAKEK
jgi:sec-independent protein translocase protein TatA